MRAYSETFRRLVVPEPVTKLIGNALRVPIVKSDIQELLAVKRPTVLISSVVR